MATNQELKEAVALAKELDRLRTKLGKEPLKLTDRQAVEQFKSLPRDIEMAKRELSEMEGTASSLYDTIRAIASEFKGQPDIIKKTRTAFRGLEQSAQNLKLDEQGILDLNRNQAKALESKVRKNVEIAKQEARSLIKNNSIAKNLDLTVQQMVEQGKSADEINDIVNERLKKADKLSDEEKSLLQAYFDQNKPLDFLIKKAEERVELESKINKLMGVTGALVGGTGALMERLGMRSGIFHEAMSRAQATMREMAKDTAEGNANFSKLQIAAAGFSIVASGFGQALKDPASFALALVDAFFEVNKAAVEFTRLTGQASISLATTVTEASNLVDLMNTASEITKQTGLNAAAIFSPEQLGQLADAKNLLGISAEQATNLGMMMKLTGQSADQLGESIYSNVDAGVSQKMVYDDILSASDDIVASAAGNTAELGRAASAARKLGMDLAKVNQIADGLMDFESSISAELEAQLLTGKNINLAKARELALNNDLEGVAEELAKNGASAAEYAKMNRIQQETLAKALGMSRQELGKMVLTEEALAGMTAEQRAQARGVTLEQSKQMDLQTKISKLTSSLMQKFAPLLEAFIPIVDVLITGLRGAMLIVNPLIEGFKVVTDVVKAITGGIDDATAQMIVMGAILTRIFYRSLATAITSLFTANATLGPAGMIAAGIGAIGLASMATSYFMKGNDVVSPGYGERTLMGPEGAIQLNNKDTVIAGTNLFGGEGGGGTPAMDTRALEAKLDRLIAAVTAGGNVYLDGNKVGQAQVLGTYKSS